MSMLGQTPASEIEAPISTFEGAATRPAQSYWNESWERLRANRIGMAAGILILILAAIASRPSSRQAVRTCWALMSSVATR